MEKPPGRLYTDLAYLWPLMSPPEDYREEARVILEAIEERLGSGPLRVLDLGSGGGHHLHHIARRHRATAVDLSDAMLAHSRGLNPGVSHHVGDMREVRLGETFDVVLIHDAVSYLLTEDDLLAAFTTARAHLRPGGLLLVVPDDYADDFVSPHVSHEIRRFGDEELTFVEYSTTAPSNGAHVDTAYVFFLADRGTPPGRSGPAPVRPLPGRYVGPASSPRGVRFRAAPVSVRRAGPGSVALGRDVRGARRAGMKRPPRR